MYTQCPHCLTVFTVTESQLGAAAGRVRCGHCRQPFDALAHPPQGLPAEAAGGASGPPSPADSEQETAPPAPPTQARPGRGQRGRGSTGPGLPDILIDEFHRVGPGTGKAGYPRVLMVLALVVAVFALGVQYAWLLPEDMGRRFPWSRAWLAELQPYTAALSEFAGLPSSPPRDAGAIRVLAREMRADPDRPAVLALQIRFMSAAADTRAFPRLQLRLYDLGGAVLARRTFEPAEYLPDQPDLGAGMEPGRAYDSRLDLLGPGGGPLGFQVDFL